ncbi:MAG: TIGR01777 family oxidoreductase [Ilumatobacteraceae bacterium]
MHILISGASGLIGSRLGAHLEVLGHRVTRLVRRHSNANEISWNPTSGHLNPADIEGVDAVVNLSGASIAEKRWTKPYKKEILDSRVQSTTLLATTIASLKAKPQVFLSGSAIGIYGDRSDEVLNESSPLGNSFMSDVCKQWESAASPAIAAGIRTAFLRTGIVLTPTGGALKKQLPLFKFGLGGKFASGEQWQSWITLDDEVRAIEFLLTTQVNGAVNLTAPNPVTNSEFTKTLARVLHRPAVLPIPSFGPKLLLGRELAESLLFSGQKVIPSVLASQGFIFTHERLEEALRSLLHK